MSFLFFSLKIFVIFFTILNLNLLLLNNITETYNL